MKLKNATCVLACILLFASSAKAKQIDYESVSVDNDGQLHIMTSDGKEILPPKLHVRLKIADGSRESKDSEPAEFVDQWSFSSPAISPDHHTVVWFADWKEDDLNNVISEDLIIYRDGQVLHKISAEPTFWDWQFRQNGEQITYAEGPLHGGINDCVLIDTSSGKILEQWDVTPDDKDHPPSWAIGLHGVGDK